VKAPDVRDLAPRRRVRCEAQTDVAELPYVARPGELEQGALDRLRRYGNSEVEAAASLNISGPILYGQVLVEREAVSLTVHSHEVLLRLHYQGQCDRWSADDYVRLCLGWRLGFLNSNEPAPLWNLGRRPPSTWPRRLDPLRLNDR
jgi:hypothetical protein